MKKVFAIILLISFNSFYLSAMHPIFSDAPISENCQVTLKTETKKKHIQILFWKHHRYKVKTVDKVVDSNSNIILQTSSYSIWSEDAGDDIKFSRLQIKDNEIRDEINLSLPCPGFQGFVALGIIPKDNHCLVMRMDLPYLE